MISWSRFLLVSTHVRKYLDFFEIEKSDAWKPWPGHFLIIGEKLFEDVSNERPVRPYSFLNYLKEASYEILIVY